MDGKESIELTEVNKSHDCQPSKLADAEKQGSVKGKNHSYKYREYLETVLLSVVIVIVTLVLLLPTIIYTLPLPSVQRNDSDVSNHSNLSSVPGFAGGNSGGQNETAIQPPTGVQHENCSTLQCREGFSCTTVENTSLCLPVCGSWELFSHHSVVAINVTLGLSAAIGVIASIAVLVISCIRWKHMFTFPSMFVVLMTVTLMMNAVFYLISYMDSASLYCGSEHLIDMAAGQIQLAAPTPFCTLTGIVFYYSTIQITMWWLCHIVLLFWKLRFPFHAKLFESKHRFRYIHITMVVIGILLPLLPVVVAFTAGDPSLRGFRTILYPPFRCDNLQPVPLFYSLLLPLNLILVAGIVLLIVIFWVIHKQHGLFKTKLSQHPFKISIAERKVLIVLCYFVLLVVVSLTALAVTIRNSGKFATTLVEYWQCEATGVDPEKQCDRLYALFEELGPPALIGISNLLYLILPLVNLIFVINVAELKQKFKTWRGQTSRSQPTT